MAKFGPGSEAADEVHSAPCIGLHKRGNGVGRCGDFRAKHIEPSVVQVLGPLARGNGRQLFADLGTTMIVFVPTARVELIWILGNEGLGGFGPKRGHDVETSWQRPFLVGDPTEYPAIE